MVMERPYNVLQAGGWELAVGTDESLHIIFGGPC